MSTSEPRRGSGLSPVDETGELRRENAELKVRLADLEKALHEAEEAQHARARALSIVEASSAAIFSTAVDGTLLCWNVAAERLYGFTSGAAIGRNALELVPLERLDEHVSAMRQALAGDPVVLETVRRRADGSRVAVRMIYARLADASGKPLGVSTLALAR